MANPPSAAELQSWHREAATSGKSELQAANALHGHPSSSCALCTVKREYHVVRILKSTQACVHTYKYHGECMKMQPFLRPWCLHCPCVFVSYLQYNCFPPPSRENSTSRLHDSEALCKRTNYVTGVFNPFTCPCTIGAVSKLPKAELSVFLAEEPDREHGKYEKVQTTFFDFPTLPSMWIVPFLMMFTNIFLTESHHKDVSHRRHENFCNSLKWCMTKTWIL